MKHNLATTIQSQCHMRPPFSPTPLLITQALTHNFWRANKMQL